MYNIDLSETGVTGDEDSFNEYRESAGLKPVWSYFV
jgi:hypothetical protein